LYNSSAFLMATGSMASYVALALVLCTAVGAGFGIFRRSGAESLDNRIALALLPTGFLIAATLLVEHLTSSLNSPWPAARLTPLFALRYGYRLYYGPDQGPILDTIYTPLSALLYFPALIFSTPVPAVLAGTVLACCYSFAPVLYIIRRTISPATLVRAAPAFLAFFLLACTLDPLNTSMFSIHADAPALGLGAAAIASLLYTKGERSLMGSSVLVVMAINAKQVVAPLPAVLCLYVLLTRGFRPMLRYFAYLAAGLAAFALLWAVWFGWREFTFNTLVEPGLHPFRLPNCQSCTPATLTQDKLKILIKLARINSRVFLEEMFWIPVGYALLAALAYRAETRRSIRMWLADNPWALWCAAGIAQVSTGLLGRAKVGGFANAYSYSFYFLLLGLVSLALSVGCAPDLAHVARRGVKAAGLALLVVLMLARLPQYFGAARAVRSLQNNPVEASYLYILSHPAHVYFPWFVLSELLAEKRLYHFEYGVVDRELAGYPPTREHWSAYIPQALEQVAFWPIQDMQALDYLPEFRTRVGVPQLPGWIVWERAPPGASSPPAPMRQPNIR
jgi:hypothetical protein